MDTIIFMVIKTGATKIKKHPDNQKNPIRMKKRVTQIIISCG